MKPFPVIRASVTFLTPEEGGRSQSAYDSPLYRPHLVVGDPTQRAALTDDTGSATEKYLAVRFTGDGTELPAGEPQEVTLELVRSQEVDYSDLSPGSTFTIREGGRVVGFGHVLEQLRNTPSAL